MSSQGSDNRELEACRPESAGAGNRQVERASGASTDQASDRIWLLSCVIAYIGLGSVLGIALWQRAGAPVFVGEPPDTARPADAAPVIESRLDPNGAEWHDLMRLPRVGEGLARRIVAYREARILEWRSAHPDRPAEAAPPVFTKPEDLLPIKGIGAKTLEQIRPYLRFDAPCPGSTASRAAHATGEPDHRVPPEPEDSEDSSVRAQR